MQRKDKKNFWGVIVVILFFLCIYWESDCMAAEENVQFYTLEKFGAIPNDKTIDNSEAIFNAIKTIANTDNVLVITSDTYYFSKPIIFDFQIQKLSIIGTSCYSSVLSYVGKDTAFLFQQNVENIILENLTICYSGRGDACCIQMSEKCENSTFIKIRLLNFVRAIVCNRVADCSFVEAFFQCTPPNSLVDDITCVVVGDSSENAGDIYFDRCIFTAADGLGRRNDVTGIEISNIRNVYIKGCDFCSLGQGDAIKVLNTKAIETIEISDTSMMRVKNGVFIDGSGTIGELIILNSSFNPESSLETRFILLKQIQGKVRLQFQNNVSVKLGGKTATYLVEIEGDCLRGDSFIDNAVLSQNLYLGSSDITVSRGVSHKIGTRVFPEQKSMIRELATKLISSDIKDIYFIDCKMTAEEISQLIDSNASRGGIFILEKGKFLFSEGIETKNRLQGITLIGLGVKETQIEYTGEEFAIALINSEKWGCSIGEFSIICTGGGSGISSEGSISYCTSFENVRIINALIGINIDTYAYVSINKVCVSSTIKDSAGITINKSDMSKGVREYLYISNCKFENLDNAGKSGMYSEDINRYVWINKTDMQGYNIGINLGTQQYVFFENCRVLDCAFGICCEKIVDWPIVVYSNIKIVLRGESENECGVVINNGKNKTRCYINRLNISIKDKCANSKVRYIIYADSISDSAYNILSNTTGGGIVWK